MFTAKSMLFIYVESPLHAGCGQALGAIDLPIQRERVTGYPMVQGSSVKGCLRAEATEKKMNPDFLLSIFGPEAGTNANEHAGAISVGDARLLLFPVRSLAGVFAWATSLDCLQRFSRDAILCGLRDIPDLPNEINPNDAMINGAVLKAGENVVVLEEFSFTPKQDENVKTLGVWLAKNALPQRDEYKYWHEQLPKKLCLLADDVFRDFTLHSTEVQTHIKLNPKTKTADSDSGALWTSESLPIDTLLYVPLMASPSRKVGEGHEAVEILEKVKTLDITRLQMGGDETTGQGMVALQFSEAKNA